MSVTPSPSAERTRARPSGGLADRLRRLLPRTFQGRLTLAFIAVVGATLVLVTLLVLNRLDDYFTSQQMADLDQRSKAVNAYVQSLADRAAKPRPVVDSMNEVDPRVLQAMSAEIQQRFIADQLARADVVIRFGTLTKDGETIRFVPADSPPAHIPLQALPDRGQTQERTVAARSVFANGTGVFGPYATEITLSNPYTFRATALANVTGLLAAIALFALGLSVLVSSAMARRFTTPLRRLTEASRGLAEGDLTQRVPDDEVRSGSSELAELAVQFNAMADRLQESVEIIRRDRDRSRDFLADVSHELRTPLAALRMFNELLEGGAAEDPETRAEFLESSGQQIERLDWLAQNLLELSKLDSGIVLLDLRPDDLRAAVENAVEQTGAAATRRGVAVSLRMPPSPIRIRHDPQRIGQVVANLVGNAVKFTPRGGSITVDVAATPEGARIEVADTGVGIDAAELPHIFERFYRGSRANEARGSGSGLGLAIVRSIVDMHGGTVGVESQVGVGSRFIVDLPGDPRLVAGTPAAEHADVASAADAAARRTADPMPRPPEPSPSPTGSSSPPLVPSPAPIANVQETSPTERPQVNPRPAP